ncbi:unannotated protein [freshwater metagenome]|uniref:Unannotated protein n=1 Tax=freshwater metagenome TaxID=449393 RepID=A0A6J6VZ94_9ZZZZ
MRDARANDPLPTGDDAKAVALASLGFTTPNTGSANSSGSTAYDDRNRTSSVVPSATSPVIADESPLANSAYPTIRASRTPERACSPRDATRSIDCLTSAAPIRVPSANVAAGSIWNFQVKPSAPTPHDVASAPTTVPFETS